MPINHRKTNPLHHNAGRIPNFNQSLTCHLSFVNFTVQGLCGNLQQAARLISTDVASPDFLKLPQMEQLAIIGHIRRLHNLSAEARELADDVAEFNRDKTKLVLPPTPKRIMRS